MAKPCRKILRLTVAAAWLLAPGGRAAATPSGDGGSSWPSGAVGPAWGGSETAPDDPAGGLAQGFVEQAGRFLGSPYRLDPLGEGPGGDVDRDPRLDVDRFDCVTLIEHSLAFAIAGEDAGDGEILRTLDKIRYHGEVNFRTRNHFFVADWIPHNSWLVEDATSSVGGPAARLVVRRMGRKSFFRSRGVEGVDVADEKLSTWVIPTAAVTSVADRLEAGMIVVLIGRKKRLFARHTGLLVARTDGSGWLLRHASPSAGVADEDFLAYLDRAGRRLLGVKLLRIVE